MGVRIESIRWLLGGKASTQKSQFYVQHQNRHLTAVNTNATLGLSAGNEAEPAPLVSRTIKKMSFKERLRWSFKLLFSSKKKWRERSFKLLKDLLSRGDQENFKLLFIKLNQLGEIPTTGSLSIELRQLLQPFLKQREQEKESMLANPENVDLRSEDLEFTDALDQFDVLFTDEYSDHFGKLEIMDKQEAYSTVPQDKGRSPYHDMIINALARGDFDLANGYINATRVDAMESFPDIIQEARGKAHTQEIADEILQRFREK